MQTQTCSRHCQGWASPLFDLSKRWYSPNTNTGFTGGVNKEKAQWWVRGGASVGKNWVWDYVSPKPLLTSLFPFLLAHRFCYLGLCNCTRLWVFPLVLGKHLVYLPFCVVWFRGRTGRAIKQNMVFVSARLHFCLLPMLSPQWWNSHPCPQGESASGLIKPLGLCSEITGIRIHTVQCPGAGEHAGWDISHIINAR